MFHKMHHSFWCNIVQFVVENIGLQNVQEYIEEASSVESENIKTIKSTVKAPIRLPMEINTSALLKKTFSTVRAHTHMPTVTNMWVHSKTVDGRGRAP